MLKSIGRIGPVMVVIGTAVLAGSSAQAQVARSGGGGGQNAALVQELEQLGSERTSLQAQVAKLQKDLDAMRKERDALKSAQQALTKRAQLSESSVKSLEESAKSTRDANDKVIAQWKQKMDELVAKFRETINTLRDVETDRASVKQTLATRERDLQVCVEHNQALYKLNGEVLDRLEHQTLWSRFARAEPFTQIKRVELQNLADDYKQRAEDQRLDIGSAPTRAATAPGSSTRVPAAAGSRSN